MSRELRHKNATGLPLNGKTQLQWVENWDVKVLWRHPSCCWDQRRRKNEWFQQQEILHKSCALTCWCLVRSEFFHTSPLEDWWGLPGFSEVSGRVVSMLMPFLQGNESATPTWPPTSTKNIWELNNLKTSITLTKLVENGQWAPKLFSLGLRGDRRTHS